MFTGIIEELGVVVSTSGGSIGISASYQGIKEGESVSVNGVCLTVRDISGGAAPVRLSFDVSPESYSRTNLGELKKGGRVNLERALSLNGRLGGHLVTGHIDAVGKVVSVSRQDGFEIWEFSHPENLSSYIAEKGSIAVDGISLTVASKKNSSFTAAVIPYTLKNTTLSFKKPGGSVNIETDILAKYVESVSGKKGVSLEQLKRAGFL